MNNTYNKSVPSVSYTTAMNLLAGKLAIHSRSTGKNATRAFDDALVHARDAAHATVFNKLAALCSYGKALQEAEDVAQTVAVKLFDGAVKARLLGYLPGLTTASRRRSFFGKVIKCAIIDVSRKNLREPKFVPLETRVGKDAEWKFIDYIDKLAAKGLMPDELTAMFDGLAPRLEEGEAHWKSSQAADNVNAVMANNWSPVKEALGLCDKTDRPDEQVLPDTSRRRANTHSLTAAREYLM